MRILLVEDNQQLAEQFVDALSEQRYVIDWVGDGQEGWEMLQTVNYDLVLLDVMLPKLDGISLCRRIRSQGKTLPVLLLTARGTSEDKVMGLDSGADDYLVKPVRLEELNARIRALMRRGNTSASTVLEWGLLKLDPSSCQVTYGDRPVAVTPKEYSLLELFLRNPQRVYNRRTILEQLWSFDHDPPGEDTVKAHIKGLRNKLKTFEAADLIETVYGLGYRLKAQPDSELEAASTPAVPPTRKTDYSRVAQVWQQCQGRILARIQRLSTWLETTAPTPELWTQASQETHKLVGSLGTFGVHEGSRLARELETQLQASLTAWETASTGELADRHDAADTVLTAGEQQGLLQLVKRLQHTVEQVTPELLEQRMLTTRAALGAIAPAQDDEQPLILVVDDDAELGQLLEAEASRWGVRVAIALNPTDARTLLQEIQPQGVLLDLSFAGSEEDGLSLLTDLSTQYSQIPVLVLTSSNALADRLAVVRLKAQGFLQKPVLPSRVLEQMLPLLNQQPVKTAKLLVLGEKLQTQLETLRSQPELEVIELNQPQQLWEALEQHHPTLLLLQSNIAQVDGLNLCQTLRHDARWSWLPVVVMSPESEALDFYQAGADDVIRPDCAWETLQVRLLNRLQRAKHNTAPDELMGIYNREQASQELSKLLQLAKISQQPLALVNLQIDQLKTLNQAYDYGTGDRILRQVGLRLRQALRAEDVVARWSGAEFVLGLYGIGQQDGVEWVAEILESMRDSNFGDGLHPEIHISLSAGIAQYPLQGEDVRSLYHIANQAMGAAQRAGGDRISTNEPSPVEVYLLQADQATAQPILRALTTRGYQFCHFLQPEEMLQQLRSSSRLPQVLLLRDGPSQNLGALQLLKQLQTLNLKPYGKPLFITEDADMAEKALRQGALDYILTPCDPQVVMQQVRRALRG